MPLHARFREARSAGLVIAGFTPLGRFPGGSALRSPGAVKEWEPRKIEQPDLKVQEVYCWPNQRQAPRRDALWYPRLAGPWQGLPHTRRNREV